VRAFVSFHLNGSDTIKVYTISFFYKGKKGSTNPYGYQINFSFTEQFGNNRIIAFNINEDPDNAKNIALTISAMDSIFISVKSVSRYRVYYSEGLPSDKLFGKNKGVFALEADAKKFQSTGLSDMFVRIFEEFEKMNIGKPVKFSTMMDYNDQKEFIQTEIVLDSSTNGIYIYIPLGKITDGKDKIIIRQLQFANLGWEYTVKKEDNMKLVKLFEAIKSKEWGMNYLDNP
jgi:hypothetical protein